MRASTKGLITFLFIIVVGFIIGSNILQAVFFGTLTLIGLVVLIESIQPIKWLASRTSKAIDILIFLFTIAAISRYGFTIAGGLTVAGLGYTLAYAPYLREQLEAKKQFKQQASSRPNKYWKS